MHTTELQGHSETSGRSARTAVHRVRIGIGVALLLAAPAPGQALAEHLEALIRCAKQADVSLVVHDASSGAILFQHEPHAPLKPASVMKLLTTAAALERFGPGFAYETCVYLSGDELWIIGAGDPSPGDERIAGRNERAPDHLLDEWAGALRARGQTRLRRVVVDDAIFDLEFRHADWPASQADRWYQPPVGALNYNDNCVDITVAVRGGEIELRLRPELPATFVNNRLRRAGKGRQKITVARGAGQDVFELTGTVSKGGTLDPVAVHDPTVFFAAVVQEGLRKRGIVVEADGARRALRGAEGGTTLLARYTTPLPDVLWRCNTFSQNLFAECLLKTLAAYEPDGRPSSVAGSWAAGSRVARDTLTGMGIDLQAARLRDGSGLSHENRVTAAQLVQLLRRMYSHPQAAVFRATLAQPNEPGSLSRRFDRDPALHGKLQAKTGTLSGVHALAGYITRPDGREAAFALLVNGAAGAELPYEVSRVLATVP